MVFDWTIKVTDIVMIVAVLIGPISAVLITLWAQKRNDKRSAKRQLFLAFIGERKSLVISNATANALNSIDVVFSNNQKVRDL
jgi:NhaP-type Na+/H+ or K+/H+ antiporter